MVKLWRPVVAGKTNKRTPLIKSVRKFCNENLFQTQIKCFCVRSLASTYLPRQVVLSFNCQKTLIVSRGPLRKIVDHTNGEKLQNHKQKCDQVGLFLKSLVDNFFIKVVNFL